MKESQLRNEMREEIAKKDLLLTQLQTRTKELQEALSRVQENVTTSKHDLALVLKEKVTIKDNEHLSIRYGGRFRQLITMSFIYKTSSLSSLLILLCLL
jgi:hypothetical protein